MPEKILGLAFDPADYRELSAGEPAFRFKALDHINRFKVEKKVHALPEMLIVTYSDIRAQKDKADRERFVGKAKFLLKDKARIKGHFMLFFGLP